MATAWPWPYPSTYKQSGSHVPRLTVKMNRADPFFERDATGWQFIDLNTGNVDLHYSLTSNTPRSVAFDTKDKQPEDTRYQSDQIPPQVHY
jgi:hypothetical protein